MSALVRYLFPKSDIGEENDIKNDIKNDRRRNDRRNDRRNTAMDPYLTKYKKTYDKSEYIKILNKSYKDILLTPDEMSFLETIPRKKLNVILNINRNNRARDKPSCTPS